jgi:starch synthase
MTKAKKILFVTQEMLPFVPETDMATIGRYLPQAVQEKSREIRSFMPKWGIINERRNQLHEVIRLSGMNIIVDDTDHPLVIKVASISAARMQIYFIDNDDFFEKRCMMVDQDGKEYEDNAERAAFYARGVLETIKKLKWSPDIIHCLGWMSSFIPLYVKTAYSEEPSFRDCKVVFTPSTKTLAAPVPANMEGIIAFRGTTISATRGLGEKKLVPMLNKLGIKYADGIGFLAENEMLAKFAEGLGKPCIGPVSTEEYGIYYPNFYDTIWSKDRTEDEEEDR